MIKAFNHQLIKTNDMRNYSKLMLAALIIVLIMPACKKYEEGPTISFRSKTARLVNKWKVEKAIQNGIDITTSYQTNFPNLVMEIKDDGSILTTYTDPLGAIIIINSTWAFSSDKTAVNITTLGVTISQTILKLKNDELWLKWTLGISVQEIHYITA
jgi:hypothetical protein